MTSLIQLRDYQVAARENLRASYTAGKRAPVLVLPTGAGKTVTFCDIAHRATAQGGKVIVLVHRQELLTQTSVSLKRAGVLHGCIAPKKGWEPHRHIQVASVQTIINRFELLKKSKWEPTLIVVDEGHHAVAGSWRKVISQWPRARVLGVTATPCRMDGAGLGDIYDDIVIGPQTAELIEWGYLAPPVVYAPPMKMDLTGIRMQGGDFARKELAERADKPTVTGNAVEHYGRECPGVPAIAFCVSIAHAQHVAEEFRKAGWKAEALDGKLDDEVRRKRIADLASGELHVLTSCDIISEGTDIPVVGCAILLRPTKSLGLYLQQVGRALRLSEGKTFAIILDHAGNCRTHGLPDDVRDWSDALEDNRKRKGKKKDEVGPPPPFTCAGCFAQIRHPLPPKCPYCGRVIVARDRMASLETVDGELQLLTRTMLTAEQLQAQEAERKAKAKERQRKAYEETQAQSLDALEALAHRRGYDNPRGWAMRRFYGRLKSEAKQTLVEVPAPAPAPYAPAPEPVVVDLEANLFAGLEDAGDESI